MISSLLNLQSKYVKDDNVLEVLQNGRNRVQSMAILHKNLYVGEDLNMVNIQHYFEGLVDSILNSYNKTENDIDLRIDAEKVTMDVESVIPLGLIVNELVTNSLKHAFPKDIKTKPEITLKMSEREDFYTLKVADNGVGIQNDIIENGNKESFGQRLIKSLSKKLKASISITNDNGTSVSFELPK
jgi:two-component sensor histidine kinase